MVNSSLPRFKHWIFCHLQKPFFICRIESLRQNKNFVFEEHFSLDENIFSSNESKNYFFRENCGKNSTIAFEKIRLLRF